MVANQVGDDDGTQLFVPAGVIGTFNVAASNTAPFVNKFLAEDVIVPDFGETSYTFSIEYADVGGIDASTIDAADVTVTPPGGVPAVTNLMGTTSDADGTTVTIDLDAETYEIKPELAKEKP